MTLLLFCAVKFRFSMLDELAQARSPELEIGLWKYTSHANMFPNLFLNLYKLVFIRSVFSFDLLRRASRMFDDVAQARCPELGIELWK